MHTSAHLLVLNVGSSSIKCAVFLARHGQLTEVYRKGISVTQETASASFHALLANLEAEIPQLSLFAIGHRIVHGGPNLFEPNVFDTALLKEIESLVPLDPTHLPSELEIVRVCMARFPGIAQVACFDTAFHHGLPARAKFIPVPHRYQSPHLRRFGFHGISYAYLMKKMRTIASPEEAAGLIILAHLGSGASLAAVKNGSCVDTTMGFTPSGGLIMGTRSGDLDPGVLIYLLREFKLNAEELDKAINKYSGLTGITNGVANMQEILAMDNETSHRALDFFCYQASKHFAALTAALGGLDTIVFSGGIGEHSALVRGRIMNSLSYLGIEVDEKDNASHSSIISTSQSRVRVRVIPTNEELEIAESTSFLLNGAQHE